MKKAVLLLTLFVILVTGDVVTAAPPSQAPDGEAYVIQPGDWLMKIAKAFYGDADAYRLIVEATNAKAAEDASFAVIDNPSLIRVGQKLWIPAPEVATEVIAYVPPVPSETQDGHCWTNFLNSPYSWSCMVGNSIFEPCLTAADGETIVCNINPLDESEHFALNLTEPLPEPQEARPDAPVSWTTWLLELSDGVICGLFSGAGIGFDEKRVNYGCTDDTSILGEPQPGTVWTVEQIKVGRNEDGFFIEKSEIVPVVRAWQPGDPTTAGKGLALGVLKNAVYQGIYDEPVQLTDGKYEGEPFVSGGTSRPTVVLHPEVYAFGDLNGDGVNDAAVILIESSGGTGNFRYLAAVINENGTPVNIATQFVGDREQVKALTIEDGEITLEMVAHGPDDPMCCPTQEVTKRYRLQDDQLVEVLVALEGTLWTLVSYGDPSDPQAVLEGSEITAEFDGAEGKAHGSAGCNTYGASYEVDGGNITIGPAVTTRMWCAEPEGIMDQENAFLAALGLAATYRIQGDRLEMRTADGALALQFTAKPTELATGEAYIVQPGDWLTKIAKKFYGDADAYRLIVEATNAKADEDASFTIIDNPSLIRVGQKLWIPAQPGSLTLTTLQNASYQGIYKDPVQLADGKYEGEPFVPGGASRPTVTFHREVYAFGDLNGDGVDDAAVILIESSGGSGSFIYLAAVINEGGAPVNVATQFVGDREQVKALTIEDGEITLGMVAHGPDDPMCCPTQEVTKVYRLQDDQLVEVLVALEGTLWTLVSYGDLSNPQAVLEGSEITVEFDSAEGSVHGSAGCNSYFGSYEVDGETIIFGPLASTLMACAEPEGIMEQEMAYLATLGSAVTYRIEGDKLELADADGTRVAQFVALPPASLAGTEWILTAYNNGQDAVVSVLIGTEITAAFGDDGRLSGSAGCNTYGASYEVDGDQITFGPAITTRMWCAEPEGIMDQENAFLAALGLAAVYRIQGDKLEMRTADGALALQFIAKPTEVAAGEAYVVQPGDWLTKIAKTFYGDADAYHAIVEATNAKAAEDASFAVIDNPSLIRVGQKLWIPAQPGSLTLAALQNASYQGIYDEPVQLTDGKYEGEPFVPGGASRPTVVLHPEVYAFGDLNGDGVDDAAVILIENSGGSGSFIYLAAVINEDGAPVNVATQFVGDREQAKALTIKDGEITLNMVAHGPDDPMCCPTQEVTKRYRLQGDQLVEL